MTTATQCPRRKCAGRAVQRAEEGWLTITCSDCGMLEGALEDQAGGENLAQQWSDREPWSINGLAHALRKIANRTAGRERLQLLEAADHLEESAHSNQKIEAATCKHAAQH